MNRKQKTEAFKHFIQAYKVQWDLNQYARTNYDEDLEFYVGHRGKHRYPMDYNESFNKLLPRVHTVMSRFMDQIYQAGTGSLVSVRPRKRSDVERAPIIEGLLNYQLETLNDIDMVGGSYLVNFQWLFNCINFGKGILKAYWRKEERIAPRRVSFPVPKFDQAGRLVGMDVRSTVIEEPQIVYDGPYCEVLHNKLFVPHPHYRNIQLMPNVFCVYKRSIDYIKKMADKGVYELKSIQDIGWSPGGRDRGGETISGLDSEEAFAKSIEIEGASYTVDSLLSDRISPDVDVIEGYGKYIFPEDDTAYTVGSGVKIKGKESEAIVHIANYKTLLKIQKNNYGYRPFFDAGAYYHPELYWDIGLIRLGKGIQEQYNTLGNLRLQNALMLVNSMMKVREDADIPMESLVWKPYGFIPVEDMGDIEPLVTPDVSQSMVFREQEEFFDKTVQEMTGVYDYNMGTTPPRQERPSSLYSIQAMGDARTKLLLMTIDHQAFKPLLKYMMLLNLWHLPDGFEARVTTRTGQQFIPVWSSDVHMDYDFTARYTGMEPALGKQFRAQQLMSYAQMWAESPYLQHYQFMKSILEMMDFHNSDQYLKTEQQVAQERMQAMQMQLQGAMVQDQLKAKEQERDIMGDVVKQLAA